MKLYTEEQVKLMLLYTKLRTTLGKKKDNTELFTDEQILSVEIPIELPSDEEIEKKANEYVENKWEYAQDECKETFTDCAKWLRDKLLNKNK
jgi:hypothetical protein